MLSLYKKNHENKDDERIGLFEKIQENHDIEKVVYPGSYAHITPAFIFKHVIFNDTYKKLEKFYDADDVYEYICDRKQYNEEPYYTYIRGNYKNKLPIDNESFDLLISQYAGFISLHCKKYLRKGGILVANNSHGDASMASIDPDFKFIAVVHKRSKKYYYTSKSLEKYFIPKKSIKITKDVLLKRGRGIGYTKYAGNYIFQKIK